MLLPFIINYNFFIFAENSTCKITKYKVAKLQWIYLGYSRIRSGFSLALVLHKNGNNPLRFQIYSILKNHWEIELWVVHIVPCPRFSKQRKADGSSLVLSYDRGID